MKRRCPECRGIIKRGVKERIEELSHGGGTLHPDHRPPYTHIVPLAEVIGIARGIKTLHGNRIQVEWQRMIDRFGPEIKILIDSKIQDLKKYDEKIASIIDSFRRGTMLYDAGGGGRYGKPLWNKPLKENFFDNTQKALSDF
jgi:uncharacterized protein (TIGR00375 family)